MLKIAIPLIFILSSCSTCHRLTVGNYSLNLNIDIHKEDYEDDTSVLYADNTVNCY